MRQGTYFEVELDNGNGLRKTIRFENERGVEAFAKENLSPGVALVIACLDESVDYGNLILDVRGINAIDVRIHEHRGFVCRGVTLSQALGALKYWLPMQDMPPRFKWEDE